MPIPKNATAGINNSKALARSDQGIYDSSLVLRVAAVGSVDDGKSTLIGRLLHDSNQILEDQITSLSDVSLRRGTDGMDFSFITDGLRAEREQGITIDVAYRYATAASRSLIIADCPGHNEYTRNMATGASNADVVITVVDITKGIRNQTRRHLIITRLMGVNQVIFAVNKMDLVDWDFQKFSLLKKELTSLCSLLHIDHVSVIPISALTGDNVVKRPPKLDWYAGHTIIEALGSLPSRIVATSHAKNVMRFAVQWIVESPDSSRSYAGMLIGSSLSVGDDVIILPKGIHSSVRSISAYNNPLEKASQALSIRVELTGDSEIVRGDMLAHNDSLPRVTRNFDAAILWFSERQLGIGDSFLLKHTTTTVIGTLRSLRGTLNLESLSLVQTGSLSFNDIGVGNFETDAPLVIDNYEDCRMTGSFMIIDIVTCETLGCGLIGISPLLTTMVK